MTPYGAYYFHNRSFDSCSSEVPGRAMLQVGGLHFQAGNIARTSVSFGELVSVKLCISNLRPWLSGQLRKQRVWQGKLGTQRMVQEKLTSCSILMYFSMIAYASNVAK